MSVGGRCISQYFQRKPDARRSLRGATRSYQLAPRSVRGTCERAVSKITSGSIQLVMVLLLAIGLGSGCNDFLTVDSEDQLSRAELFSTVRGADAAVVGLYQQLTELYDYRYPIYADLSGNTVAPLVDLPAGNALIATQRGLLQLRNRTVTPELANTGLPAFYDRAYRILFQAADILDGLALVQDGQAAQLSSLSAEARTIRALVHFELLRLFAQAPGFTSDGSHPGVVLIDEPPNIFNQPARASVAEGYAFIRNELALAASGIDERFSVRSGGPVWVNAAVVQGLSARVAAYATDWPAVVEAATIATDEANTSLTPATEYVAQWRTGALSETLWQLDLQQRLEGLDDDDVFNTTATLIGSRNPRPVLGVSEELLGLFSPGDLRRGLYVANEAGTVGSAKWPLDTGALVNPTLLRLSDLYLLRAEAFVELGELALAADDYLAVRQRALPGAAAPELTATALREAIRTERRLELAFENHHFFDLGRWGLGVPAVGLVYPDDRFVLPLPDEALLLNPSLLQNAGY